MVTQVTEVAKIAASTVPGVGEAMDIAVILDANTPGLQKTLAGFSLLLSIVTLGESPNFGRWYGKAAEGLETTAHFSGGRGGRAARELASEAASAGSVIGHNSNPCIRQWDKPYLMNSDDVFFTQSSIKTSISGDSGTIHELAKGLKEGTINPKDIPAVRIYRDEYTGKVYSLDNRRLWAAKEAGVDINVRWATEGELSKLLNHVTTTNGGTGVIVLPK